MSKPTTLIIACFLCRQFLLLYIIPTNDRHLIQRFGLWSSCSWLPNPKEAVADPCSAVRSMKEAVANPCSAVRSMKEAVANPIWVQSIIATRLVLL